MFVNIVNTYCDYVINTFKIIKKIINHEPFENYILSLTRSEALKFFESCNKFKMKLYPTRKERNLLYKQLKGKKSPVMIYSYGKETNDTRKTMIIKKK